MRVPAAALAALLMAPAARAPAQEPVSPPVPAPEVAVPAAPPAGAAEVPAPAPAEGLGAGPWNHAFSAQAGWGYYEVTHLGVAWHVDPRAAFAAFGGYGAAGGATTWSAGLSFAHALFGPLWTLQPGWSLKAIAWTRSDANYDWTALSVVLGATLAKDLGPRLRLTLDGGVALTGALQSDRKQDFNFGHPERWNGSVCLELGYRIGGP